MVRMASYKTGPGKVAGTVPRSVLCPLICEHCFEALGIVGGEPGLTGLSVDTVGGLWPDMAVAVGRHDRLHAAAVRATENSSPLLVATGGN
jgi:hypothetical protein